MPVTPQAVRPAVDWATWAPRESASLVFVLRGDEVLLIRKKRGLGAGKIDAPGGRLEPGESPAACAVREVQEEVGVTPLGACQRGELSFQFVDGYALHLFVFVADGCEGEPYETPEAAPRWVPRVNIPIAEMWADVAIWLPRILAGESVRARFVFDGDSMLGHELLDVEQGRSAPGATRR
jgi:8-oxo-dGTP diphosphatase